MPLLNKKLNATAILIANSILERAVVCATKIEEIFWAESPRSAKFTDEHFQDIVTEFVHTLIYLSYQDAHAMIREPKVRDAFIDGVASYVTELGCNQPMSAKHPVPPFTRKIEPQITVKGFGIERLTERCAEYSRFTLFAAENKPLLSGTVGWEFGKHIVQICDRYHHDERIQSLARDFLMDMYKDMTPLLCKIAEFRT